MTPDLVHQALEGIETPYQRGILTALAAAYPDGMLRTDLARLAWGGRPPFNAGVRIRTTATKLNARLSGWRIVFTPSAAHGNYRITPPSYRLEKVEPA